MSTITGTWTYRSRWSDDGVADTLQGTINDDFMYGYGGADNIRGASGSDVIDGGRGNDTIRGGTGVDWLTGGSGTDTFVFGLGDSGPTYSRADVIEDFNVLDDYISFRDGPYGTYGTASNYHEQYIAGDGTYSGTYAIALAEANRDIGAGKGKWFGFYTDGQDGYLFADLDLNGTVETGIELRGLDSPSDMNWSDII